MADAPEDKDKPPTAEESLLAALLLFLHGENVQAVEIIQGLSPRHISLAMDSVSTFYSELQAADIAHRSTKYLHGDQKAPAAPEPQGGPDPDTRFAPDYMPDWMTRNAN